MAGSEDDGGRRPGGLPGYRRRRRPPRSDRIAEIDGLRAFAVTAVLLFHAFPSLVPGGFIGVDVFFVISGFVISRSYLFPLIEKRITLRDFYLGRVRRLAPACVLVIIATAIAAFGVLEPRVEPGGRGAVLSAVRLGHSGTAQETRAAADVRTLA